MRRDSELPPDHDAAPPQHAVHVPGAAVGGPVDEAVDAHLGARPDAAPHPGGQHQHAGGRALRVGVGRLASRHAGHRHGEPAGADQAADGEGRRDRAAGRVDQDGRPPCPGAVERRPHHALRARHDAPMQRHEAPGPDLRRQRRVGVGHREGPGRAGSEEGEDDEEGPHGRHHGVAPERRRRAAAPRPEPGAGRARRSGGRRGGWLDR